MLDSKEQEEKEFPMLQIIDGRMLRTFVIVCLVLAILVGLFLLIGAHAAHAAVHLQSIKPCPQDPYCYQYHQ